MKTSSKSVRLGSVTMLLALVVAGLMLAMALAVYAASNNNDVEWLGTGHAPGSNICGDSNFPYRAPFEPAASNPVDIRIRVYKGDISGVTVWYTSNSSASQQSDWSSVSGNWTNNWGGCGGLGDMDIWKATIPALNHQQWYKIAYTDGTDTDWRRASGEGVTGMYSDDGGWTTSSTSLTYGATLAVDLAAFTTDATAGGVTLAWETVSETDNAGFNVYRADTEAGPWAQINKALIPTAAPGSSEGHAYTWLDATASPGTTSWYLLEDIALDGTTTRHPPVAAALMAADAAPNAVGLATFGAVASGPSLAGLAALVVLAGAGLKRRKAG